MREEDSARARVGPRGKCICSGEENRRMHEERARDRLGRASTRSSLWPALRLSEGVYIGIPGEKIFPINTARNGRMNAGKNRRMTNCGGSFSGAFAFSSRFQRIFDSCRAISPLDSPLLQEFLSLLLSRAPTVLVKRSSCIRRGAPSAPHRRTRYRGNYERPGVNRGKRRRSVVLSFHLSSPLTRSENETIRTVLLSHTYFYQLYIKL